MRPLLTLVLGVVQAERPAFLRGLALSVAVLLMGAALLGLSGWFITASAAAGLAGLGILFNVFAPSAMVRFLALGRTAARYGERVLTHDATLRALSRLRVRLLRGVLLRPQRELDRLRASVFLNRVTADVDALDGALLRLVLPGLAGGFAILVSALVLWRVVHPAVALIVGAGYLILPTLVFLLGRRMARKPARRAEAGLQAGRSRLIDLIAGRDDLAVYGQVPAAVSATAEAFGRHAAARAALDRIERRTGAGLDLIGAGITAAVLSTGIALVQAGQIGAAQAAIGPFVALALAEAVAPVRRALTEIGRMTGAARRVLPLVADRTRAMGHESGPEGGTLRFRSVGYSQSDTAAEVLTGLTFDVRPGEIVALTGPSGSGKSTALYLAAGALTPGAGRVLWGDRPPGDWPEKTRARTIALVPQRHALVAGTIAENLRLADPGAEDAALWQALATVHLAKTIRARGGLEAPLGFRGTGLSGGEGRRLVLARALLRHPALLLLDEPTEGLDDATARAVLTGLRAALPRAAILMAAHRAAEIAWADRIVPVTGP